jgi:adenine-specific DNA-methyltransferase
MIQENSHFDINNRKYLGSKNRLLDFLEKVITQNASQKIGVFVDIFSGTGVVANRFRKFSKKVIANDILFSNFVINKVFLNSTKSNVNLSKVEDIIKQLNELKSKKGYCYKNFGDTYFTKENAGFIDAIREKIEVLKNNKTISKQEYYVLLTSLIFAVDKIANTVGQYDAYLKHIGKNSYDKNGKHLSDSNIYKKIELKIPIIIFDGNNEVYNTDANKLIKEIKSDVLYLDPPYNHRQYVDSYHLLENIIRWEKPAVFGKTKKFNRDYLKSKYSKKGHAIYAFEDLINNAKCKHIFLSYNNEGIIPDEEIERVLKNKGELKIYKTQYKIFGNGAGQSQKRPITERVFYCKVKNKL